MKTFYPLPVSKFQYGMSRNSMQRFMEVIVGSMKRIVDFTIGVHFSKAFVYVVFGERFRALYLVYLL